jgi:DNA-3-methyladenine glycosylase II
VLLLRGTAVGLAVTQIGPPDRPRLRVKLFQPVSLSGAEPLAVAALDRLLGLRVDLSAFYALAARDPVLASLARRFRGLKPPRFPTIFEALVNAIACQQITLTMGIRLLNRLAEGYGYTAPDGEAVGLPEPVRLARVEPEALRDLGFSRQKALALVGLARTAAEGRVDLEALAGLDDAAAVACLRELRGIGRWTAEYVLLRGLGRLHVFPGDDVGARRNLRRWLALTGDLDYAGVQQVLAAWQPYAGLIYFHLLLDRLAASTSADLCSEPAAESG